jgi:hypothetical protein
VCLDEPCWKKKWENSIYREIREAREQDAGAENIIVYHGGGNHYPEFIENLFDVPAGEEKTIRLGKEEFRVLSGRDYSEADDDGECDFTALSVSLWREPPVRALRFVRDRDGEEREPVFKIAAFTGDIPEEEAPAAEKAVLAAHRNQWNFENAVQEAILEKVVRRQAESGKEPKPDAIDAWFKRSYFDQARMKRFYAAYTGKKFTSFSKAFKENTAAAVFFILRSSAFDHYSMPDRKEMKDPEKMKKNEFMKFSGLAMEEYQGLYGETAAELAREAMAGGLPAGEEGEEEEDA